MLEVVFILSLVGFFTSVWLLICNNLTYRDRMSILDSEDCRKIDLASYDEHLWYRMTFRDWRKLYV